MNRPAAALILTIIGLLLGPGVAGASSSRLAPSPPVPLPRAPHRASAPAARPAANGNTPLPHTGFGVALLGLIGVAMVGGGTILRRRPRHLPRR